MITFINLKICTYNMYKKELKSFDLGFIKNFTLLAQPIVSLQNNQSDIEHFEFLARFMGVGDENIAPDLVFTKSRTNRQLGGLDLLVIKEAMKQLSEHKNDLTSEFNACINVSEVGVKNSVNYYRNIEFYRDLYGIKSNNITLEITEFSYTGLKIFTNMGLKLGYSISVDDFGSEHSAPGKIINRVLPGIPDIKNLNGNYLDVNIKLDKSFVEHISDKANSNYNTGKGVFETFLGFKKDHPELTLIAEGVETHDLANYLQDYGVDYGQGFLWSKAIPLKNYAQPNYHIISTQKSFDFK
jgi:EAL domain-containing protein (putative c-di-GMP-specific phosphodiesterase class I)